VKTLDLLGAVAKGQISAAEVCEASISRIGSTDSQVNAFTEQMWQPARLQAQEIDRLRQRGETVPALAGLPFAVKNLFDIEGVVTLAGSKINRSFPAATADAVLIQRLKAAGAVLLGALNMDEYAYGFTTENAHYGPTHNPHDLTRVSGGSSGGSGASVAAEQNGSIRVPASLCGVWGLKPTFGRLSRRGTYPFVHSIDHLGPLGDCVEVLALSYDAMQGADALDPGCHVTQSQPVTDLLWDGIKGLRIGILTGYFDDFASAPAQAVARLAAHSLGATDQVIWPDAQQGRAAAFIVTASEGGSLHLNNLRSRLDEFEPLIVDRLVSGALQPADWYVKAQRFRRVYRARVNALFENWDVLIAPATPICAPVIGSDWIEINGNQHPCRPAMGLLTQPISFAGCPVVAAPMWPDGTDGMPIAVQLISAPWREDLALRAAMVLQQSGASHLKKTSLP
jgi:AtzE family amidohydrolase